MDPIAVLVLFIISICAFVGLTLFNLLRGVRVTREAMAAYLFTLALVTVLGCILIFVFLTAQ